MKRHFRTYLFTLVLCPLFTTNSNAQSSPTVIEVHNFFNNQKILITYREGEVLYGTYYFLEVHYCPTGQYGLYGKSIKNTVLGNEQHNNWQEFGTWKAMKQNGQVGMYYATTAGAQNFIPVARLANGDLSVGEGYTIVKQGQAICM